MQENKVVSFQQFLVVWNQAQGMKTPQLHQKMAQWLERQWVDAKTRVLLMAFRSAGKSTIVGIFAAWLLYCNPNIRILVLAAEGMLARKMVRNVKRVVEVHPFTIDLKPKNADQWASDSFTVVRSLELRDPSMLARGVTANITGSRADVVICDDVEVPNTCDTAEKREELRNRLREMAYILVAGGTQIYVGTPHHYYSIYADVPRKEIGEDMRFLHDFERLALPILNEDGVIAWPERYTPEIIEKIQLETGPNKFSSQMMLQAINILNSRLDVELLQYYNCDIEYSKEHKVLYLGHLRIVRRLAFWDPSMASGKGDDSVVAVVYSDEGGNYYLHHIRYIKLDPLSNETSMVQQCKIVAQLAKDYHLTHLKIEDNGLGKHLPGEIITYMRAISSNTSIENITTRKNKEQRIVDAFDAILAAKRLYVHESVCETSFIMEMREWRANGKCRDDGLDAVAGALEQHPAKSIAEAKVYKVKTVLDV